jgi:hypothetical protein
LRKRAGEFFESLSVAELAHDAHRQVWVSDWMRISDDYRALAATARGEGSIWAAREADLCTLTSLEVARSLNCDGDPAGADLAEAMAASLESFERELGHPIERITLEAHDDEVLTGFFVPAPQRQTPAPTVICVAGDDTRTGALVSRLLPVALRRNISLLLTDAGCSPLRGRFKPEQMLRCWLDHLAERPEVDPRRIAVYGEGEGAGHASRLALSDRRLAAAVCDGGLSAWTARHASVRWMTGLDRNVDDEVPAPVLPSRLVPCPLLMVVGGRSILREQDALALLARYREAEADCSVVVPHQIVHPMGEVENFVAADDFVFDWLDGKLGGSRRFDPVIRL